jgi:hypothetical protein
MHGAIQTEIDETRHPVSETKTTIRGERTPIFHWPEMSENHPVEGEFFPP